MVQWKHNIKWAHIRRQYVPWKSRKHLIYIQHRLLCQRVEEASRDVNSFFMNLCWPNSWNLHSVNTGKFKKNFADYWKRVLSVSSTIKITVISPGSLVSKFSGKTQFSTLSGDSLCGNCAFSQNFQTRKLCELATVFYAVMEISRPHFFPRTVICFARSSHIKQNEFSSHVGINTTGDKGTIYE